VEVIRDGEIVPLRGAMQRRLLSLLVLHGNGVIDADRLADDLWSGAPPPTATTALQVHVARLRQSLEPGRGFREASTTLVTRPSGYVLELARDDVDAFRFEDLVGRARAALGTGRLEEAVAFAEAAAALWRGPALPDLSDEPVARAAVARWEELRAAAEEERMEAELALGRHAAVVGELEALVRAQPLRERRTGQLMVALYRCGRQAEALRAFASLRAMLVEELGLEPGPELRTLEQSVLAQDLPAPATAAGPRGAAGGPTGAGRVAPFVGRDSEVARAVAALETALTGDSQVLLVSGEAGIGKTRLVEEVAARAGALGVSVWSGRCYEDAAAPAYWPWVQVLRAARAELGPDSFLAGLGPEAAVVTQVLPEATAAALGPSARVLGPEEARFRLFDAFASVLGRLAAAARPIMVVLDDLHWADGATLRLLRSLVPQLRIDRPRLLFVGLYRDTEVGTDLADALGDMAREQCVSWVRLRGLAAADVARLVDAAGASDGLGDLIHRKTDGNPLYVRELLRLLEAEGRLAAPAGAGDDLGVPATIREIVASRTRRFSSEGRQALAVAAVAGARFDVAVLERVTGTEADVVLQSVEEALAAGVVVEDLAVPGAFRFSHDIVRETLYREMSAGRRARLHAQVGTALAALGRSAGDEVRAADLAHHFTRAADAGDDPTAAVAWSEAAARDATRALAYEEAVGHYERAAVAEARCPADPGRRGRLLLALGDARWRAGDVGRARETFLEAAGVARTAGEAELLADAVLGIGGGPYRDWHATRGAYGGKVVELLEEALATIGADGDRRRIALLGRLAEELYYADDDRRLDLSQKAVDLARRLDDPDALVSALCSRCVATWDPDHLEERLAISAEIVARAAAAGSRELGLFGRHYLHVSQLEMGDTAAACATLDEFEALAAELRQPLYLWEAAWFRAMHATAAGDLAEGERLAHEAFEIGFRAGDPDALAIFGVQIGVIRLEQDRTAEMEPLMRDFAAEFAESPAWRAGMCLVEAEVGEQEKAREELARLAEGHFGVLPRDFAWLAALAMLAEACALLGERGHAATIHDLLLPYARRNLLTADRNCWGSCAYYLGLTAATAGRLDDADRWFSVALDANRAMALPVWVAHTRYEWARTLLRRDSPGDAERAAALLDEARGEAAAIGLARLARLLQQ
jgi:DNA-binding SARP family transcriptional activator